MEIETKKISLIYVLCALFICMLCSGCSSYPVTISKKSESTVASEESTLASTELADQDNQEEEITVYVCGAVVQEGVYVLESGARINDALTAAGGFADDADSEVINLAESVQDGEKIYFPRKGETENAASEHVSEAGQTLVNINTADVDELMQLPGIGETRAERIAAYRQSHGSFADKEELKNVSGIGDSIYSELEEYITVD